MIDHEEVRVVMPEWLWRRVLVVLCDDDGVLYDCARTMLDWGVGEAEALTIG
jgi:hypothetical protein